MRRDTIGHALAWIGLGTMALFAMVAICQGQCGPGGCPVPQPWGSSSQFRDPDGGGTFCPINGHVESACMLVGASGTLVSKGANWGVIWTCAHGRLPSTVKVEFPVTRETFSARLLAHDKGTDVALYQTDGRPRARIAKVSTRQPQPGEKIAYGGFGMTQKWQAFSGQYIGPLGRRGTNSGSMDGGLNWRGSCRSGDSGGPVWTEDGMISSVTGTGRGVSVGPNVSQVCQLIRDNGYVLPWNADLAREQSRNESEVAREQLRTEQERLRQQLPLPPSVSPGGSSAAVAQLSAQVAAMDGRVSAVEQSVQTGRELVDKLGLLDADVETVANAAELLTGKVADAEAKAAEADAKADSLAGKVAEVATGVDAIKSGIASKAKEAVIGLLTKFGPWGVGGIGLVLFLFFRFVQKDLADRRETGDPLAIEKLAGAIAGKTSNQVDDRGVEMLANILDRLAPRPEPKPPTRKKAAK